MTEMNRRRFLAAAAASVTSMEGTPNVDIDRILKSGIAQRGIPAVVAMVGGLNKTLYSGAFGRRDASGPAVEPGSIFRIASMTKAITTVAALQLVEDGKVDLDGPVSRYLREFEKIRVLDSLSPSGKPVLRPPAAAPTVRQLLTHTSGLCYDTWDGDMFRYRAANPSDGSPGPLMFDPGARWQYGQGLDWAGKLVETVSGMSLEDFFQRRICRPLGMKDTSFLLPAAKFARLVANHFRAENGDIRQMDRVPPKPPGSFNGGGGLYSTAPDYLRFMQAILNRGEGPEGARILNDKSVAAMMTNQIGALTAGKMKSFAPSASADVDIQPGHTEKWGLGFLINIDAYGGGRAAGSLAWAGLYNTFYWIDPARALCAVILMQFLPFVDKRAVAMLADFERAIYRAKLS